MAQLGDFLKSINFSKQDVFAQDPTAENDYVPFVVNRSLSYFVDTLQLANEVNLRHDLPHQMQFDFLRLTARKGKRFKKWEKKQQQDQQLKAIKEYYNVNSNIAEQYRQLLTEQQIQTIEQRVDKGGK